MKSIHHASARSFHRFLTLTVVSLGLIVGGTVTLETCRLQAGDPHNTRTTHKEQGEAVAIQLGVFAPTTGDFASYGQDIVRGATLAKEELLREGVHIELLEEDVCSPERSILALKARLNTKGIDGIAANFCVIGLNAMVPVLRDSSLLAMQLSALPEALLDRELPVVSPMPTIADEAHFLANVAYEKGYRRIAILALETQWGESFSQNFTREFEGRGGDVVFESRRPIGENEFRSVLLKVRASKAQAVFLAHIGSQAGSILQQAKRSGVELPFFGTDEAADPLVREFALSSGIRLSYPEVSPQQSQSRSDPADLYFQRYGSAMSPMAERAFGSTQNLARALVTCNRDARCVKQTLESAHERAPSIARPLDGNSRVFSLVENSTAKGDADKGLVTFRSE